MYSDLVLDNDILREVIEKKLEPEIIKELAEKIVEDHHISISLACCLMEIYRFSYYYKKKRDDTEVINAICSAAVYGEGFQYIYAPAQAGNAMEP